MSRSGGGGGGDYGEGEMGQRMLYSRMGGSEVGIFTTQFTCCTSTRVQILTPETGVRWGWGGRLGEDGARWGWGAGGGAEGAGGGGRERLQVRRMMRWGGETRVCEPLHEM